jgi:hypothetical protein
MYGEYYGSTMTTEHLLTHHEQQADAPRFLDSIPSELEQLWDKFCRVLPETGLDQSEQMRALWMDTDMPQILRDRALLSSQVRHPIASKVHIEAYAAWQKELLAYVVSTGKTEVYDNESMAHAMMRLFGDGWISRTEFEDFLEHFGVERADGIFRQLIRPKLGYGLLSAKDSKQPSIPVLFPILHMDVYAADGEDSIRGSLLFSSGRLMVYTAGWRVRPPATTRGYHRGLLACQLSRLMSLHYLKYYVTGKHTHGMTQGETMKTPYRRG